MSLAERVILLRGGLDLVSPRLAMQPGTLAGALNYEADVGGYRRCFGYERFDGRLRPSEATYAILDFEDATAAFAVGNTITGATSSATAIVLAVIYGSSDEDSADFSLDFNADFAGGIDAGYLVISEVTGTFQTGEAIRVSGVPRAVATGPQRGGDAPTLALDAAYAALAIERRRALIQQVPGSGPIRGVALYAGDVWAFRDNAGATACVMHKATASGWVAQTFGRTLAFDAGTTAFTEGATVTGATSGATGVVRRVVQQSGLWSGTAAGYLVLSGVTGTFQDNEIVAGGGGSATANGVAVQITLPPGGRYRFAVHNFFGASNLTRLYGVNGVGRAFEWDGTVLAPIRTGLSDALDKPTHIAEYAEHLFLGFRGGSLQNSGTGKPLSFMAIDGAAEYGIGQDITGLGATKTALIVTGKRRIDYLTGRDSETFNLVPVSEDSGAMPETFQIIGEPKFLDNLGIRSLRAADTFGNFRVGTDTQMIEPLIRAYMDSTVRPCASARVRRLDTYRIYFDDGSGVSLYYGRKNPEAMPFTLGFVPSCLEVGFDAFDRDVIYAGDANGWVYQMDSGTSFDGEAMPFFLQLAYFNDGTPNRDTRWHSVALEIATGTSSAPLSLVADFGYGDEDQPAMPETIRSAAGAGGIWDISNWDEFLWSSPVQGQIHSEINGVAQNIAVGIVGDHTYESAHTIGSITYFLSKRRARRLAA
jgi:hypothetical protein